MAKVGLQSCALTESQLAMYLDWNGARNCNQYNICFVNSFPRTVDAERLANSLSAVFAAYPVYSARLAEENGEFCLKFNPDAKFDIPVEKMGDVEFEAFSARHNQPFDPFNEPLVRAAVVVTPSAVKLFICIFHLIADGTSQRLLLEALADAYEGREMRRETASLSDYAALEQALEGKKEYAEARDYLIERFHGVEMSVPADPKGAKVPKLEGDLAQSELSWQAPISRLEVDEFCRKHNLNANLFFMGVFARTLSLYTRDNKVAFVTFNHGRRDARFAGTHGFFVKTLPCLAELNGEMPLADFLASLKIHKAGIYPFTHFREATGIGMGMGFVFQHGTVDSRVHLDGITSESKEIGTQGGGSRPTMEIFGNDENYLISMVVAGDGYTQEWIRKFVERSAEIARQFLLHPDSILKAIPTLSSAEREELLELSRGEKLEYPAEKTVIDWFDEHAERDGGKVAFVDCERKLTYAEAAAQSREMAAVLARLGVRPGSFVGLMLPRRVAFQVALTAVQRCGAGYVPLDHEYPDDRIAYMLENSEAPVLITTHELFGRKAIEFKGEVVFFEEVAKAFGEGAKAEFRNLATPETPAYMIYTSGSTGRPKGVVISQYALAAMCASAVKMLGLDSTTKNAVIASFSFDASVMDLFMPMTCGGESHIIAEETRKDLAQLRDYVANNGITGSTISTQLGLATINAYPDIPFSYVICGGEAMVPVAKTKVRLYNGYGPTEFTVASSFKLVNQDEEGEISIGRPVANTSDFICDSLGQLMPRGMVGELCLSGVQIAQGYWREPKKTANAFVDLPFEVPWMQHARCYRTGDYAQWNDAGEIEFRGRIDKQVKLRGFRIEFGEIETAAAMPGVVSAVAEVREIAGTQHLVLYYVGSVGEAEIKAKMSQTLTGYMIPEFFVRLDTMPITPGGKIDRRSLPIPELKDSPKVEAANELEAKLLALVCETLNVDSIGVTHDFKWIGLTSLGAIKLAAKIRKEFGVSITLSQLEAHNNVRELSKLIGDKGDGREANAQPKARRSRPRRSTYPMTENQRGVYASWLRQPDSIQYNVPAVFHFANARAEKVAKAARTVIDAHPALKTRFEERNGEIVQVRRDEATVEIEIEKLSASPDEGFFSARLKPFAVSGEDLVRARVFEAPDGAYLALDIHHSIFDGVSLGVFMREMSLAMVDKPLCGEMASAFDAALDERDYMESEMLAEDEAWFGEYLEGVESTRLESSGSAAAGKKPGEAGRVAMIIPAEEISHRAGELGVSASDWFLAAFMELLRRICRTDDVQIAFVSAGRANADYADTMGMFVRTLPVRNAGDEKSFSGAVRKLHSQVLELIDRDRCSYARLVERFGLSPEIIFAFEGGIVDLPEGVEMIAPKNGTVKFPLSVTVTPAKTGFEIAFEYDASLYTEPDMQSLLKMFSMLSQGATGIDSLKAIPLVDESEAERLGALAYGGDLDYDRESTFVSLVEANAIARPFATAVVDAEGSITYSELTGRANALAAKLRDAGVKVGEFVGVMLPRRISFAVSLLAAQKCGAGYVPIDADYPVDRIAYMLENSQTEVLVTTHRLYDGKKLNFGGKVICLEDIASEGGERINLATPETPAYMIYTSGSTGRPKGVVVSQKAVRHMVAWMLRDFGINYSSRTAEHASFSFDASVIDIFPTLAAGAELHLLPEELRKNIIALRDYVVANGITGMAMSTQIGMTFIDSAPDVPLEYIMLGGEKMMPVAKTKIRLYNGYGPTEFCVCSSYEIVDQQSDAEIPIGRAVPGTWSYIVDGYGHLLPKGFPGEIALAGPQLANGYWQLEEKTATVFTPMAFERGRGLCYRTGDLARYGEDGKLQYLGRIDSQIKLRGFRIEIGEIEHAAMRFDGISRVAAEVREVAGAKHLVLYYSASGDVDEAKLKAMLAQSLAEYMVPDYFVRIDDMPMTPNGKINRKSLPVPSATAACGHEFIQPREGTETTIATAFAQVLKLEKIGANDDFFVSGGTSLLAIKAVVALQKGGLDVQYADLFKYKTPRSLATFIAGGENSEDEKAAKSSFDYGKYDYGAIDKCLAETPSELFDGFKVHSLGDVMLTGATGYLGIHVLRYLLQNTSSSVVLLARPKGKSSPERRVSAQYVYYFGEQIPARCRDRISIVEGDITDKNLSEKLADSCVSTVINCAAMVKHFVADETMDRVNIGGVENLISWCERSGARLIHTSTYSIGGMIEAASPAVLDERRLFVGQDSDNDYVRTKFVAERKILQAVAEKRIRAKIMRLGNLMGRESDGEFQMNVGANAFVNSLKSYKAIGAYPVEELASQLEMSPIDRVAEAICLLSTTPDGMNVFHPYNTYPIDMGMVLGAMNRRGYEVDFTSRSEFAAHVDALRNDPGKENELQGILHYAQRHLGQVKVTPVVNRWTTTVLYRLGFRWKAAEDEYLVKFFDMLEGLDVFSN